MISWGNIYKFAIFFIKGLTIFVVLEEISKLLFELRCLCGFLAYVCLSEKKLFNGCKYQKMLVYKVVTCLKRMKMAVLFLIFLDQIRPKWIKLDQN